MIKEQCMSTNSLTFRAARLCAMLALASIHGLASAQAYPSKPIRMVAPYPPGGIDNFARPINNRVSEMLGQPVVIDNRGGANGFIGSEIVARAPADGYTLLFVTSSTLVVGVLLSKAPPFDPVKDFTPVANLIETLQVLTVSGALPINSVKELIDYAKRNPGKLTYASSGIGSIFHLNGENLKLLTGIDMLHVPFKGTAPMATDLVAGRVDVGFPALLNVRPYLSSGKVKVLAMLEDKRNPDMPNVPTLAESVPGFHKGTSWTGIFGPAGLPRPIVTRLNGAFLKAMEAPEVREFFSQNGAIALGGTPEEFADRVKSDLASMGKLVQAVGIPKE
jgi:tripartite-type tricarboxylate transporter receptor subunit TctC